MLLLGDVVYRDVGKGAAESELIQLALVWLSVALLDVFFALLLISLAHNHNNAKH